MAKKDTTTPEPKLPEGFVPPEPRDTTPAVGVPMSTKGLVKLTNSGMVVYAHPEQCEQWEKQGWVRG